MAFMKYARAAIVRPHTTGSEWAKVRTAAKAPAQVSENLIDRASGIFGKQFNPKDYLLTHCTIVASVDTYEPPNAKLGSVLDGGFRVNRKYGSYRVKTSCDKLINNNFDFWPREVLLKSYRTFIGAHNFCFAPGTDVLMADGVYRPIEDVVVGDLVITHTGAVRKVTHKFERDYEGPIQAIHVDRFKEPILVTGNHPFRSIMVDAPPLTSYGISKPANRVRYRADQITSALRDGKHSFGAAYPKVRAVKAYLLANGPSLAGDVAEALGHARSYGPVLLKRVLKRHTEQFECRPLLVDEHPLLRKGRSQSRLWSVRADAPTLPSTEVCANKGWVPASDITNGMYLLGPEGQTGSLSEWGRATLLGYYLAEGCRLTPHKNYGVVLSFGAHERNLVEHAARLAEECFPGTKAVIQKPLNGALQVRLYGADIDQWMVKHGGVYSETKRIHEDVFLWDQETLLRMFAAWIAGDGDHHKGTLRLRGSTTSRDLGEQMQRVAELCEIKSSLVFEPQRIGEVTGQVMMTVGGESRTFDVTPRHHRWTVLVSKGSTTSVALRTRRWGAALYDVGATRKRQDFAWWGGCRVHRVTSNKVVPYMGKVYNLEVEDDHSYVVTHGLAAHNCEHVQVEELSKGRIIDAVARDVGESVYVDILIATDRKHTDLVAAIESGKMSTLSMGCTVTGTQCTKCGHWAADETEMCSHIKYEKGNTFFDEQGRQHRIAEKCGDPSIDPTGGVTFIEASWVGTPAFTGAVLRNILALHDGDDLGKAASDILETPPDQWSVSQYRKAAALAFGSNDRFMAGWEEGEEGGEEAADTPAKEKAPDSKPFEDIEKELEKHIKDRVRKKLKKEMELADTSGNLGPEDSSVAPNDNVVKQSMMMDELVGPSRRASYGATIAFLCRTASNDVDLIDKVAMLNSEYGVEISVPLYRVAVQLGSVTRYRSADHFIHACRTALGRKPSIAEAKVLMRLGKLISRRGQARRGVQTTPGSRHREGDVQ